MKIVSIVGARPQFVKAAVVSRAVRRVHREILVHTGQHYDDNMSAVFFSELDIPRPDHNLGIGSGAHGAQTGAMLMAIERILVQEKPDWVLVYGDTNSTLAGALAAAKLNVPVVHVEAGLRSFNRDMPEEINRIVADQLSDLLFCPSQAAVDNLAKEGITRGVHLVGDVMADALAFAAERAATRSHIVESLGLKKGGYLLATVHRAENTDDPTRLKDIIGALETLGEREPVVFPVHPRTKKRMESVECRVSRACPAPAPRLAGSRGVRYIEPVGYLDMVMLEQSARVIVTDSGGVQKEAYWLGVPCITLRQETEWVETVTLGWNRLAGERLDELPALVAATTLPSTHPRLYGTGRAAEDCVAILDSSRSPSTRDVKGGGA